jgi:hypothetical protein
VRVVGLVEALREVVAELGEAQRLALSAPAARSEQVVDRQSIRSASP